MDRNAGTLCTPWLALTVLTYAANAGRLHPKGPILFRDRLALGRIRMFRCPLAPGWTDECKALRSLLERQNRSLKLREIGNDVCTALCIINFEEHFRARNQRARVGKPSIKRTRVPRQT